MDVLSIWRKNRERRAWWLGDKKSETTTATFFSAPVSTNPVLKPQILTRSSSAPDLTENKNLQQASGTNSQRWIKQTRPPFSQKAAVVYTTAASTFPVAIEFDDDEHKNRTSTDNELDGYRSSRRLISPPPPLVYRTTATWNQRQRNPTKEEIPLSTLSSSRQQPTSPSKMFAGMSSGYHRALSPEQSPEQSPPLSPSPTPQPLTQQLKQSNGFELNRASKRRSMSAPALIKPIERSEFFLAAPSSLNTTKPIKSCLRKQSVSPASPPRRFPFVAAKLTVRFAYPEVTQFIEGEEISLDDQDTADWPLEYSSDDDTDEDNDDIILVPPVLPPRTSSNPIYVSTFVKGRAVVTRGLPPPIPTRPDPSAVQMPSSRVTSPSAMLKSFADVQDFDADFVIAQRKLALERQQKPRLPQQLPPQLQQQPQQPRQQAVARQPLSPPSSPWLKHTDDDDDDDDEFSNHQEKEDDDDITMNLAPSRLFSPLHRDLSLSQDQPLLSLSDVVVTEQYAVAVENARIPAIIFECCEDLEKRGLKVEGIFRLPGSSAQMNNLLSLYQRGNRNLLDTVADPMTVAGLLKLYLRNAQPPLIHSKLYDIFARTVRYPDEKSQVAAMRNVLFSCSAETFAALRLMFYLLEKISTFAEINLMSSENISKCFGPSLFSNMPVDSAALVTSLLIKKYRVIFDLK